MTLFDEVIFREFEPIKKGEQDHLIFRGVNPRWEFPFEPMYPIFFK